MIPDHTAVAVCYIFNMDLSLHLCILNVNVYHLGGVHKQILSC